MRSSALPLLLATAQLATAQVGRLIVCVQEGSELIDLDQNEIWTGAGSDAFVTVMVQADGKETQTRATTIEQDNASPLWNECFDFGAGHTVSTSVVFAVADGDMNTDDDVIGVACTSAGTGTRWLELGESSGGSSSSSTRGRIKVQIMLIADELIDASEDLDFELSDVLSELSAPPTVDYHATATVSCPSGRSMVACQCWSAGNPGCAGSSIEYDAVRNSDVCRAEAHPAPPPPTPPPPCDAREDPACRLSMLMPPPPPPVGIRASARCGAFDPRTMFRTVRSGKSRSRAGDAVEATCPVGYTPLGCSLSEGSSAAIGARFEAASCDDTGASSCTDGREACVAYAAAQHTHDGGVRAEARCAKLGVEQASGMAHLSVPVKSAMLADVGITSVTVACPAPLQLTGCACMSAPGNCRGAQFAIASGPPPAVTMIINGQAAAVEGGADAVSSSASGDAADVAPHPVCNASLEAPLKRWWTTGGSANAQCVWVGRASRLLGRDESGHVGELCALHGDVLADKPWLPAGWKAIVSAMAELNQAEPGPSPPSVSTREAGSLFGSGFVAGFFTAVSLLCFCVLGAVTLKRRHLNTLGGSPLQAPAPPLGSPLPASTTTMAAPLVLNDSAVHA